LPALIERNNMLDHKRNENVVCWKYEFSSFVNKSVTAKAMKLEIELAASP